MVALDKEGVWIRLRSKITCFFSIFVLMCILFRVVWVAWCSAVSWVRVWVKDTTCERVLFRKVSVYLSQLGASPVPCYPRRKREVFVRLSYITPKPWTWAERRMQTYAETVLIFVEQCEVRPAAVSCRWLLKEKIFYYCIPAPGWVHRNGIN